MLIQAKCVLQNVFSSVYSGEQFFLIWGRHPGCTDRYHQVCFISATRLLRIPRYCSIALYYTVLDGQWYWMVLDAIPWHCMVLCGIAQIYFSHSAAQNSKVLHCITLFWMNSGIGWYFMAFHGIVWYCTDLFQPHGSPLHSTRKRRSCTK